MFPILLGKNNDLEKRVKTLEDSGGGGSSGGGILVVTDNNGTLDKTWQEIHDAVIVVYKKEMSQDGVTGALIAYAQSVVTGSNMYAVSFTGSVGTFATETPTGFPDHTQG